jgi:hypothetical protein
LAIPEDVFETLKANKLVRIENIADRGARQVVFERGAIETLKKEGFFFKIEPPAK